MPGIGFISREIWRIISRSLRPSLFFFLLAWLNHLLISLVLTTIININYLLEVFTTRNLTRPLIISLTVIINSITEIRLMQYGLLLFFTLSLGYLHLIFFNRLLTAYRSEINLIFRLEGDRRCFLIPLLGSVILIEGPAVLLARTGLRPIYNYYHGLIVRKYIRLSLLSFDRFNTFLLVFLLLYVLSVTLVTLFYQYRRLVKKGSICL